eukprot:scaffold219276_cov33-Prasinocladus_malaysianus.AAC.1
MSMRLPKHDPASIIIFARLFTSSSSRILTIAVLSRKSCRRLICQIHDCPNVRTMCTCRQSSSQDWTWRSSMLSRVDCKTTLMRRTYEYVLVLIVPKDSVVYAKPVPYRTTLLPLPSYQTTGVSTCTRTVATLDIESSAELATSYRTVVLE